MKYAKKALLFAAGGSAYVVLELLWRRRSHVSMFAAGGTCFLLLGKLGNLPLSLGSVAGAGVITAVELGTGLLVNRDYRIWDYRNVPGNWKGQICPTFSLLWIPVSFGGITLYRWLDGKI